MSAGMIVYGAVSVSLAFLSQCSADFYVVVFFVPKAASSRSVKPPVQ